MGWEDDPVVSAAPQNAAWQSDPVVSRGTAPRTASGPWDDLVAGGQATGTHILATGRLPDVVLDPHHAEWYDKALEALGSVGGDLPLSIPSAIAGFRLGGPKTAAAAAMAVPTEIREALVKAYSTGEADSSASFLSRIGIAIRGLGDADVMKATAKAAAVGALTVGAGQLARPFGGIAEGAAEFGTLAVAPAALEGRLPEMQDFANAAVMVVGLKAAGSVAPKIAQIFARTGIEPAQVVADAKSDPAVAEELKTGGQRDIILPPIEPGFIRVFRGEDQAYESGGIWGSTDKERAQSYAEMSGEKGGRIVYQDVPSDAFEINDKAEGTGTVNNEYRKGWKATTESTSEAIPKAYAQAEAAENAKAAVREPGIKYPEQTRAFADNFYTDHPQDIGGEKVKGYPNVNMFNVDGLEKINSVDDLAAMSASAAEKYKQVYESQRAGLNDQQLITLGAQKLADIIGTGDIGSLINRVPGTGAGAVEMWTRGQAALAFADNAKGLADAWNPVKSSPEDTIRMMAAAERFAMVQAAYEGAGSEAGRAMRVRQLMRSGMNPAVKKMLDDAIREGEPAKIAEAIKTLNDPAQVAAFTRKAFEPKALSTLQKIQSAWKTGLLSGTKIFQVKAIGDNIALASNVVDKALASGVGLITGSKNRITLSDVREYISGVQAGARDTLKVAGANWTKHGEQQSAVNREGYRTVLGEQAEAGEPSQPPAKGSAADIGNRIINIPSRFIGTETNVYKMYNEQGYARYAAARQAREEGLSAGAADYNSRVADILRNPTPERALEIEEAGKEGTFTNKGGAIWRMMHAISKNPVGGFIIPFDTVPSNLTKWAVARMPGVANLLDTVQADFKAGGAARDVAIARQMIGGAVLLASYAAVKSGVLTGGGIFMTAQEREAQKETRQDNSIVIGDKAYSIARFEPLSRIVQLAADVSEMMDHLESDDRASLPVMAMLLFGHATLSETYLSGMNNLMKALDDPTRAGPQYFDSMVGSMVPSLLAQVARAKDPQERRIDGWFDAIQSRLPGLREEMLTRVNPLTGEPEPSGTDLTPMDKKKLSDDPVLQWAQKLGIGVSKAPKSIDVGGSIARKEGRIELTPEQQNIFLTTSGKIAHTILTRMVNSPRWDDYTDRQRKDIYAKVLTAARKEGGAAAVSAEQRRAKVGEVVQKIRGELDNLRTLH